jgi:hypothetical protein
MIGLRTHQTRATPGRKEIYERRVGVRDCSTKQIVQAQMFMAIGMPVLSGLGFLNQFQSSHGSFQNVCADFAGFPVINLMIHHVFRGVEHFHQSFLGQTHN